jgi:hypothetical protein
MGPTRVVCGTRAFPTTVGNLPWGHVGTLLDQVKDPALRDWYADRDARNGWSRPVLEHHVATGLHHRIGAAPSNFDQHLDPDDADQAQEIVRDPYVFDFLDLTERSTERALEQALTDRLQDTLAELGPGPSTSAAAEICDRLAAIATADPDRRYWAGVDQLVRQAREINVAGSTIGAALHVSGQAVWARYHRTVS